MSLLPSQWLAQRAALDPKAPAIIDQHGVCTYSELNSYINTLANKLRSLGLAHGAVIATNCHSRVFTIGLTHALPLVGYALQLLNPDWLKPILDSLLANTNANYLLVDPATDDWTTETIAKAAFTKLPAFNIVVNSNAVTGYDDHSTVINVRATEVIESICDQNNLWSSTALQLRETQMIVATSGSEGKPKAVMLTGGNIVTAIQASRERITLEVTDRWLLCLPLYHIGGMAIILRCAQAGAAVVLTDGVAGTDLAAALAQKACTHVSLVPAMLARLLAVMPNPPSSLRYALVGGAALDPKLARQALAQGWPLCISYGMSEACSQVATICNPELNWPGQMVGKPLPGIQVKIGPTGRINLRGDAIMLGYANPQHLPGIGLTTDGWFETSDLGYVDECGQVWITGRADHILITGGVKINPIQIEHLLENYPGIIEAAISAKVDSIWGDYLVAVIAGEFEVAQIDSWCRAKLPGPMRPRAFIRVSALPRTTLGKLNRAALRTLVADYYGQH